MAQSKQELDVLFEQFKETVRRVCAIIEDITIENIFYTEILAELGKVSPEVLKERVAAALLKPENWKAAHALYAGMWKALDEVGVDAYFEALLRELPSTGKAN